MAVVDELQINIVTNAEAAESALSGLAGSITKTGKAATGAKDGVNKLANGVAQTGEASDQASGGLTQVAKNVKAVGKAAQASSGFFANFVRSIGRIAMYRMIRSAIKAVTSAVLEGSKIFIDWDRNYNNGMAGAAKTIDELSAKWTQLKKTIGAAIMPVLQAIKPALMWVMDIVIHIFNVIQQIVRALQGEHTWYRAIYKEAKKTTKEAEKLQRILFGFDELNVLPSQNSSSSDALSGRWDYVTEDIDPAIQKIFGTVGKVFDWVFDKIKTIYDWLDMYVFKPVHAFVESLILDPKGTLEKTNTAWNTMAEWVRQVTAGVLDLRDMLKNPFTIKINDEGVTAMGLNLNNLMIVAKNVFDFIITSLKEIFKLISNRRNWNEEGVKQTMNNIGSAWADAVMKIRLETNTVPKSTQTAIASVVDSVQNKGVPVWGKFQDSVKKTTSTVTQEDKKIVSDVSNTAKEVKKTPIEPKVTTPKVNTQTVKDNITSLNNYTKKNPIAFTFKYLTSGLGKDLGTIYNALQTQLSKVPLKFAVGIMGNPSYDQLSTTEQYKYRQSLTSLKIPKLAEGGTIPNVGTLFLAGESGPEAVANMGSHTGVMNVGQMQEAVAEGNVEVVNAIYAVLNALNAKDTNIYLDSRKIGESVTKYQSNQARRGIAQGI